MITIDLERKEKYILTCSYGPDSMALFDLLKKDGYNFVVAHVNYHILTNADEDEENLRNYCEKNNIKLYVKSLFFTKEMGNEEGVARTIRYDFFKELSKKLGIKNVLVAHNLNDSIETYLLQLERKNFVTCYGLSSFYELGGVNFIRPLLNYSKAELLNYCDENHIPYSIDYSNFDQKFRRNYLRHSVISKYSEEDIKRIKVDIFNKNLAKNLQKLKISKYLNEEFLNVEDIKDLSEDEYQTLIYEFLKKKKIYVELSKKYLLDFKFKCLNHKGTFRNIKNGVALECSYKKIYCYKYPLEKYSYEFSELMQENTMFSLNSNSILYKEMVKKGAKIIKPVDKKDKLIISNKYQKTVNRLFIDWKMPLHLREVRPGIYDKDKNLIYTPRYREDYKIDENSLLIFNSTKLIKECKNIQKQSNTLIE